MRVDVVGSGSGEDPRRPDLPDGVSFDVVEWHDDDTVTVTVEPAYRLAALERATGVGGRVPEQGISERLDAIEGRLDTLEA